MFLLLTHLTHFLICVSKTDHLLISKFVITHVSKSHNKNKLDQRTQVLLPLLFVLII